MRCQHSRIVPFLLAVFLGFAPHVPSAQPAAISPRNEFAGLQVELDRVAATVGGTVGVGIRHIESGRELYLNRNEYFPMASVFKLPLAVQFLSLVDKGEIDLDKTVRLQASDLRAGSGKLVKSFGDPRQISLRELLEMMMIDSDNTATDILWKEAGGAQAVMARIDALRISGISVDRPTGLLLPAAAGFGPLQPGADLSVVGFEEMVRKISRSKRAAGVAAFLRDGRDTATPEALVSLLLKVWRTEAVSPAGTTLLLDIMHRCETGKQRLKGDLPRGTKVAHKTGTLRPNVVNDAGIISLPGSAGHVIVAVLIKGSSQDLRVQERAIAEISRAVYDYFESISGHAVPGKAKFQ